jgi:hypothetical protein
MRDFANGIALADSWEVGFGRWCPVASQVHAATARQAEIEAAPIRDVAELVGAIRQTAWARKVPRGTANPLGVHRADGDERAGVTQSPLAKVGFRTVISSCLG